MTYIQRQYEDIGGLIDAQVVFHFYNLTASPPGKLRKITIYCTRDFIPPETLQVNK